MNRAPARKHSLYASSGEVSERPPTKRPRNARRCNALDGKTWLQYSISIWNDIRKSVEECKTGHPASFPVMLVRRVLQMLMHPDQQTVLDPFLGSGSTALGAFHENKKIIGLDICERFVALSQRRLREAQMSMWSHGATVPAPVLEVADARDLHIFAPPGSVDLCLTSPPYWDILNQRRTADAKSVRHYGNLERDLGTIKEYEAFLEQLAVVFRRVFVALKPDSFCVVVVMDLRKKNLFFPFHSDVATMMQRMGFIYDDLIIWDRRSEYNNLRPLGYPSVFRVNKVHEYILLFKTPAAGEKLDRDRRLASSV